MKYIEHQFDKNLKQGIEPLSFVDEYLPYGFVAGCVWGDDSSWKIQFLDLSNIDEKIFKREDKFGYIKQPSSIQSLKDCFIFDDDDFYQDNRIQILLAQEFYINTKQ